MNSLTDTFKSDPKYNEIIFRFNHSKNLSYYNENFIKSFKDESTLFKSLLDSKLRSEIKFVIIKDIEEYIIYVTKEIVSKFIDNLENFYIIKYGIALKDYVSYTQEIIPKNILVGSYIFKNIPMIRKIDFSVKATNVNSNYDRISIEYTFDVDLKSKTTRKKRINNIVYVNSYLISFLNEIEQYLYTSILKKIKK